MIITEFFRYNLHFIVQVLLYEMLQWDLLYFEMEIY